jgi:hypothetical protein
MTNPNSVIGQLLTTTLDNYKNTITDNIENFHPLLVKMKANGNIIKESGGVSFQEKISYAANGTVQFQGAFDNFDTTPQDVITTAEFGQKTISGTITMSKEEMLQNAGKERLVNLMESKVKNLEASLKNTLGTSLYSNGTGAGGKELGGLQLLIADDPTLGTVGGIDRSSYAFWRNQLFDFSTESVTPSATTIQAAMNSLYRRCQAQAGEQVDVIAADDNYFGFFENSLQTISRISSNTKLGELGFDTLKYKSADVFYDPECPADHMYFINSKHLYLKHLGDFLEREDVTRPVNQNVYVLPITGLMNLTIDNSRVHGVITA